MKRLPQLKDIEIFKSLDDAGYTALANICETRFYSKGQTVFYKDDMGTDLYIVFHGGVKAMLTGDNGDEIILTSFESYEIFGEMNLFDSKGRSLTVVADPEASLGIIKKEPFFKFLIKYPEVSVEIIKLLINRLRETDEWVESITFLNVKERIINVLHKKADTSGIAEGEFIKFEKYTHQELAARVASSRESVTKCLKALSDEGFLKTDDQYFYINR